MVSCCGRPVPDRRAEETRERGGGVPDTFPELKTRVYGRGVGGVGSKSNMHTVGQDQLKSTMERGKMRRKAREGEKRDDRGESHLHTVRFGLEFGQHRRCPPQTVREGGNMRKTCFSGNTLVRSEKVGEGRKCG
jgi:hypothetical protein